jgi:hypothetical protein
MKTALTPTHRIDPVLTIRQLKLASLPIALRSPARPIALGRYETIDQYLNDSAIPDLPAWRALMSRDGFKAGESVDYQAGPDHWNAVALDFASSAKAADFQRTTLSNFCSLGLIKGLKQIPSLPGAFTLTRLDPGTSPYRAVLLVGSSVVHLNLCTCIEATNPIGLVTRWANVVAAQLGVRSQGSPAQSV